ncbi:hypothetical protein GIX45_07425 [Erwinia sp. CPCC 100877]|nr:hypothetical protein [Erwinia sp. CPCC 100877]
MMKKNILIYQHSGSGNHGSEALAHTIYKLFEPLDEIGEIGITTTNIEEDITYSLKDMENSLIAVKQMQKFSFKWLLWQVNKRVFKSKMIQKRIEANKDILKAAEKYDICVAIGGDHYCYDKGRFFWATDSGLKELGKKIALVGASIEPEDLNDPAFVEHLNKFDFISVRESISYDALAAKINEKKLFLNPDSAFLLKPKQEKVNRKNKSKRIGINVSPMIISNEKNKGITLKNYLKLVEYLLSETDWQISFIPHVVWTANNDLKAIEELTNNINELEKYKDRITIVTDGDCLAIKAEIAACDYFVGARTHATIAAYSLKIPTFVVGYSVKAKGIAKDLFNTYEGYVIPVQQLKKETDLLEAFTDFYKYADKTKQQLELVMDNYAGAAAAVTQDFIQTFLA